jgi:hypothetical protein
MTRQINLNSKRLLPGFGPVQLPAFAAALCFALIAGSVWFYIAWAERQKLLAEEEQWSITLEQELTDLTNFQNEFPNINNEPELVARNTELSNELAKARETYSGLANQVENAIDGFNESLVQLSDYDLDGLWLNKITLQDGRRSFALEGYARAPGLIPLYLEQLGQSSFDGITIKHLDVAKEENANLWRFTLSNNRIIAAEGAR